MSNELYKAVEQFLIARDAWEGNPAVTSETPGVALDHLRSVFANARASTPESITHPDATTEWKSPHDPSDCQVTCPVHLRWADEVEAYMGPDYIRTRALEEAAKVADEWMRLARQRQNIATVIKDVQGRDIENVVANTSAQIAIAIRALPPPTPQPATPTPCPDCEQARATNDAPGFYLDNCEKHRAASPSFDLLCENCGGRGKDSVGCSIGSPLITATCQVCFGTGLKAHAFEPYTDSLRYNFCQRCNRIKTSICHRVDTSAPPSVSEQAQPDITHERVDPEDQKSGK